jgi:hypothetical protein
MRCCKVSSVPRRKKIAVNDAQLVEERKEKLHPVDFLGREKCSIVNADPIRDRAVHWELFPG